MTLAPAGALSSALPFVVPPPAAAPATRGEEDLLAVPAPLGQTAPAPVTEAFVLTSGALTDIGRLNVLRKLPAPSWLQPFIPLHVQAFDTGPAAVIGTGLTLATIAVSINVLGSGAGTEFSAADVDLSLPPHGATALPPAIAPTRARPDSKLLATPGFQGTTSAVPQLITKPGASIGANPPFIAAPAAPASSLQHAMGSAASGPSESAAASAVKDLTQVLADLIDNNPGQVETRWAALDLVARFGSGYLGPGLEAEQTRGDRDMLAWALAASPKLADLVQAQLAQTPLVEAPSQLGLIKTLMIKLKLAVLIAPEELERTMRGQAAGDFIALYQRSLDALQRSSPDRETALQRYQQTVEALRKLFAFTRKS